MKLTILSGTLTADRDARVITGLLLPYGEPGRTSSGTVTASAGALEVADSVLLNLEHDPTRPVGRMVSHEETDAGLMASFSIARTRAGDDVLEEAAEGLRTGLSVEVDDVVIRAGALLGGTLTGAASVTIPAFPSAQLVAADAGDLEDPPADPADPAADPEADPEAEDDTEDAEDGPDLEADALDITPETTLQDLMDALAGPDTPTDPAANVAAADQEGPPVTASRQGLAASAGARSTKGTSLTLREFTAAAVAAAKAGDRRMIAALNDVTQTGVGADVSGVQFLGELWSGVQYNRRFVPLLTHGDLTAYSMKGWRWVTPPEVWDYAGDKAAITSEDVDTEAATTSANRLAGGNDIDRKFVDFPDEGFLESYVQALRESYARKSDLKAAAFIDASATALTADTVPTGVSAATAALVDAALGLVDVGTPTFAILGNAAYRSLLLTPKDQVLEFLSMSLGLEQGSMESFTVVPGGSAFGDSDVVVGIKAAATFYELPGVPIRVDALDIEHGGIDIGLFGYWATLLNDARGIVKTQPIPASISQGADFAMTVGQANASRTVIATYADGSTADVSADAVLTSATPAKATIVANQVHPVAAGTSVITATYQGKTDDATVTVS
jgi:hypothetical protein